MEFVEGRGMEPACSIPSFDENSYGGGEFRFSGEGNKIIKKANPYDDAPTTTIVAALPVEGPLKLQFKVKSWEQWLEIGFASEEQWDDYYIGHDLVGFAYNVFTDAESTGYWYGDEQASTTEFIHEVGDIIEVVAFRDTGKVFVANYRNGVKTDFGLQITNENLQSATLYPAINMQD